MNPSLLSLATQYNLEPATLEKIFAEAARTGFIKIEGGPSAPLAADNAFDNLKLFTQGKFATSQVPDSYESALAALGHKMELRDIPWDQAKARPRTDGLPEGLFAMADAKDNHAAEMTLSSAEPPRLRFLGARILLKRAFLQSSTSFAQWIEADLAVDELEGEGLLRDAYEPLRAGAKRNRTLGGALAPVEKYLYEPAQKGVETRAELGRDEKRLAAKIGPAAHARGVEEGVKLATTRMEGFIDDLFDSPTAPAPAPEATDRRGDRR